MAIVVVKHKDAHAYNHNSSYSCRALFKADPTTSREEPSGARIYLHRNDSRPTYSFGKGFLPESEASESEDGANPLPPDPVYDIYLPIRSAVKQLFELVPDRETGRWRIDATSSSIVTVAGVDLRKPQLKATPKKDMKPAQSLPHSVYLDASVMTVITYGDITVKLWMIQSPGDVLRTERDFKANSLHHELQNVENRIEDWAQNPYIWDRRTDSVSSSSWRVTQRFTGELATAKFYQGVTSINDRDREMLMFSKANNHSSIVRYYMATELHGVPAAITDTHQAMVSFAALEPNLPSVHPGIRCRLAADMFRPLFSALEWLHCNRIIHASVAPASVLIQIAGNRLVKLLLVDYSNACIVDMGEEMPQELMRHEGAQAMSIIETCSNIWELRQKPLPEWKDEQTVAQMTVEAEHRFILVKQNCSDFFYRAPSAWRQGEDVIMLEFLALQERKWAQAREAQIRNPGLLQVGPVTRAGLQKHMAEWNQMKPRTFSEDSAVVLKSTTEDPPMILSLGHAYLDDLLNPVCSAKVYPLLPLPHEICNKLRTLEGEDHKPWQTIRVESSHAFTVRSIGRKTRAIQIESRSLADYLAACIKLYPAVRKAVLEAYDWEIISNGALLFPEFVESFHEQLKKRVQLPASMDSTLEALWSVNTPGTLTLSETFDISYHRPSQMFNVTQMHNLATINQLFAGLSNSRIQCNNFVEVRGQPDLEGNFVPLEMLPLFAEAFGITVLHQPEPRRNRFAYNPADFSRNTGRVVLAHEHLVAYASMSRTQNQVTHCPKDESDFQGSENFLSTYFGDWKVLPKNPSGMHECLRPSHWAKYETAAETEARADVSKRKTLRPHSVSSRSSGSTHSSTSSPMLPVLMDRDPEAPCHLMQAIRDRATAISQASTSFKRPVEDADPDSGIGQLSRRAMNAGQFNSMTLAFATRNPNLHRRPEGHLDDPKQHFPLIPSTLSRRLNNQYVQREKHRWMGGLHAGETWEGEAGTVRHPAWAAISDSGVSLDSEARRDLAMADGLRRAAPTVVDDTSVEQKRAPETVLGTLTASVAVRHGIADPSVVRALENRSFENLSLVAVAHRPQSEVAGQPSSSQSFFEGMSRARPDGMSRGQFRRWTSSAQGAAAEMVPWVLGSVEEGDEEAGGQGSVEDVEDGSVDGDWDGDSRMMGADD